MEYITKEDFNKMMASFAEAIKSSLTDDKNLWDDERCAIYLTYSVDYFKNKIACLPHFPRPIVLPIGTEGRKSAKALRDPKEVRAWAARYKRN